MTQQEQISDSVENVSLDFLGLLLNISEIASIAHCFEGLGTDSLIQNLEEETHKLTKLKEFIEKGKPLELQDIREINKMTDYLRSRIDQFNAVFSKPQ